MKAVCLSGWVTAREMTGGRVYLFTPSDATEAGHISPPSEIYLTRKEIAKLASEFPDE